MSIPGRLYKIAKYKFKEVVTERLDRLEGEAATETLDRADRLEKNINIRADANRELDSAMVTMPTPPSNLRSPDQIASGIANSRLTPDPVSYAPSPAVAPPRQNPVDPLENHYRLLGVQSGSDFAEVQAAYNRLSARSEPTRFPEGTAERSQVEQIREKLDVSFRILRDALDPTTRRFDLLELDK